MIDSFNLRAYGILIHHGNLLLLEERYAGKQLIKFPGGGVELGEGIQDTLEREFREELNLEVIEIEHFYTQDFFVPSAFRKNEQIQTFYYSVKVRDRDRLQKCDSGIQSIIWMNVMELENFKMPLPVDEIVRKKLIVEGF